MNSLPPCLLFLLQSRGSQCTFFGEPAAHQVQKNSFKAISGPFLLRGFQTLLLGGTPMLRGRVCWSPSFLGTDAQCVTSLQCRTADAFLRSWYWLESCPQKVIISLKHSSNLVFFQQQVYLQHSDSVSTFIQVKVNLPFIPLLLNGFWYHPRLYSGISFSKSIHQTG